MDSFTANTAIGLSRSVAGMGLALLLLPLAGCRICADCEDMAYPAYGGAWQRTVRNSGRVGSIFDPGGARASDLVSRDMPPSPDELERDRQGLRPQSIVDPEMGYGAEDLKSDEEREKQLDEEQQKSDELQQKQLDDIEEKMEEELRRKNLDDINVRLVPGQPMPPIMQ